MTVDEVLAVYDGSDGEATKRLYAQLMTCRPRGYVAVNLLRACKASERAKKYRGRSGRGQPTYRAQAYERKDWAIAELCRALVAEPDVIPSWGWGWDAKAIGFENVLYVDVPGSGQISFHTSYRRDGPDYSGQWDGARGAAPVRIARWAVAVLGGFELTEGENHERQDRTEGTSASRVARGKTEGGTVQEALDI